MNSTLYKIGIIAGGIDFILVLSYGLAFFQMGDEFFTHPYLLSFIVSRQAFEILLTILVLKYFHYKNYRTVFLLGIIVTIPVLVHFVIMYNILAFGKLGNLHFSSYLILMVSVMLYSLGLIFSNSGERLWLKRIGVSSFAIGFILITTLVFHGSETIRQINLWTDFSGTLLLIIFWIMNFSSELKESKELTGAKNP
jgi:hypothetical protein